MAKPCAYKRERVKPGIYRRPSGKYEAFAHFNGKTYSAGTHATIREAQLAQSARLTEVKEHAIHGAPPSPSTTTFAAWALNWLERVQQRFKPSTTRVVKTHLRRYLEPALGHYTFASLKPYLVETILATVAPTRSAKYRRNIYQTAQWVLDDAAENGLMAKAPEIPLPSVPVRRVEAVPAEDIKRVIAAMPSPMREAAMLALLTGIREGELLALTWDAIDLDGGKLMIKVARDQSGIEVSPKSNAAVRTIPLSPATIVFLRAYKDQQEQSRQERLAAIDRKMAPKRARRSDTVRAGKAERLRQALAKMEDGHFLFPAIPRKRQHEGRLPVLDDSRLRKAFQEATRAAGVPMRWHDLRHAFASIMLADGGEGVLPVLAAILGHSSSAFTLHQYTHMLPTRAHSYMTTIDDVLGLGLDNPLDSAQTRDGEGDQNEAGGDTSPDASPGGENAR